MELVNKEKVDILTYMGWEGDQKVEDDDYCVPFNTIEGGGGGWTEDVVCEYCYDLSDDDDGWEEDEFDLDEGKKKNAQSLNCKFINSCCY